MPLTTIQAGMMDSVAQYYSMKNRIINGAMVIDQRNAGASVAVSGGAVPFTLDRWWAVSDATGAFTVQQISDAPAGFNNSLRVTITTAATTVGSNANYRAFISQTIEGFNVADLGWGAAGASTITVSFWVKSSVTGLLPVSVTNYDGNRGYPTTFTVNAANTWEYKTITIPGDTTGTWYKNNSGGLSLYFPLGEGSNRLGTANTWNALNAQSTAAAQNIINTINATFQITGVQLEKGSTATSFDYRPYGTELALCQRYLPAVSSTSPNDYFDYGQSNQTNNAVGHFTFLVTPRVPPTGLVVSNAGHITATNASGVTMVGTSVLFSVGSLKYARWILQGSGGLTIGQIAEIFFNNSNGFIYFTGCEL